MNTRDQPKKKRITSMPILETALALAEASSWEKLRLHDVAVQLDIRLADIQKHYREKEDLSDAWFERANEQMLLKATTKHFLEKNTHDRLHYLIMSWLDALSKHRKVTCEMVCGKLEPGHLHVTFPALLGVSRTVQWIREAAQRDQAYVYRAIDESALTLIFLTIFFKWLKDNSEESYKTQALLHRLLNKAAEAKHFLQQYFPFGSGK